MKVVSECGIVAVAAANAAVKISIITYYHVEVCRRCAQLANEFRHRKSSPTRGI